MYLYYMSSSAIVHHHNIFPFNFWVDYLDSMVWWQWRGLESSEIFGHQHWLDLHLLRIYWTYPSPPFTDLIEPVTYQMRKISQIWRRFQFLFNVLTTGHFAFFFNLFLKSYRSFLDQIMSKRRFYLHKSFSKFLLIKSKYL